MLVNLDLIFPLVKGGRTNLVFLTNSLYGLLPAQITVDNGLALAVIESAFSHGTDFLSVKVMGFPTFST
jgi:hypothetical protein